MEEMYPFYIKILTIMNLSLDLTLVPFPSLGLQTRHWNLLFYIWLSWNESHHKSLFSKWPDLSKNISERPEKYRKIEVFTAVTMKNVVFWDVVPCIFCLNRRFGGIYCLHLHGRKPRELRTSVSRLVPRSRLFYHEDGGNTFLRNVGLHKIFTTSHPRRLYFPGNISLLLIFFTKNQGQLETNFDSKLQKHITVN
jgi:hypothetical protein